MVVKPEEFNSILIENNNKNNIIMEKKKRKSISGGEEIQIINNKRKADSSEITGNKQSNSTMAIKPIVAASSGVGGSTLLEGMSSAEITMIRRLAGNDANVRKKTMRKLRKWLSTLVLRFPDDLETRSEVEPNIVRVWKALFYCMWMADKPLPQEQLAEQISNLVPIVGIKPNVLVIFVEWFFRTISREWNWIDRFRLDKFMMLFRRFLRKTLQTMASRKWSAELVNGFLTTIRVHVFNHHPEIPSTKFKKGAGPSSITSVEPIAQCPMGLQLHFIDIFLEELAKAGADGLKPSKVLKFLSPFIEEMASNSDDRVLDSLKERIFHHLMKQSDVGIDYHESLMCIDDDSSEDADDNMNEDDEGDTRNDEEEEEDDTMGEDEVFNADPGPLDPRAGAIDVILPQLQLDYSILAEKLTEAGGSKLVKKRNRSKLYSLASSFKELSEGQYPLALPEEKAWQPDIPKHEVEKAAKRLLDMEANDADETKVRKTKKQRRRDARKLQQQEQLDDTIGSEDSSVYLNDSDFLDRVDDNYFSYVDEQMDKPSLNVNDYIDNDDTIDFGVTSSNKKKQKKRKSDDKKNNDSILNLNDDDNNSIEAMMAVKNCEPVLKKKKKYKTVIEFEGDELNEHEELSVSVDHKPKSSKTQRLSPNSSSGQDTIVNIPKKKRKSLTLGSGKVLTLASNYSGLPKLAKRKCKSLSPSNTSLGLALTGKKSMPLFINTNGSPSPPQLTPINQTELLRKKLKVNKRTLNSSDGGSTSRRINFVLTKNLEHEATDYMPSISKSPAIPFDASKTPTSGILKSKLARGVGGGASLTPLGRKSVGHGIKTSPRKKALNFF